MAYQMKEMFYVIPKRILLRKKRIFSETKFVLNKYLR